LIAPLVPDFFWNASFHRRRRRMVNTTEFAHAQRQRKKVEALFAELKNQIGVRRLRLWRLKFVREQFFLAGGGAEPRSTKWSPRVQERWYS
jgi:hypothetical protein